MKLSALKGIAPWEWPESAGEILLGVLRDSSASEEDLLVASELGGDLSVVNDDLVDALTSILRSDDRSVEVRANAAISLGPVLEFFDLDGFEETEDMPIAERTFLGIQESLRKLYADPRVPTEVRRRVLEAAVRAPQEWQQQAIGAAFASGDPAWQLTAVFCMRFVKGFEKQILEALGSDDEDLHYQAVIAAGTAELSAAWPHITNLIMSDGVDKELLLAAVDAVATIDPERAGAILFDLLESTDDEEITEAVEEAMAMAEQFLAFEAEDGDESDDDEDVF